MQILFKLLCCFLPFLAYAANPMQALPLPAWAENGGVMYCIYPRVFSEKGDIKGIADRLPYLQELGVNILWILPLYPIGEKNRKGSLGSPYSVKDYYAIDPAYGTKDDFKNLIQKAHQMGFKVIVDCVLNHTAWDSVLINKPAFYKQNKLRQIISPEPDWSDVAALDYSNPEVHDYMINMLKYWLKEFDLDGFRFDAASYIPLDFWAKVRTELIQIKSDILLLGEEELPEALAKAFNLDYDWNLEKAIEQVMVNGAPAQQTLASVIQYERDIFPIDSRHLRFIDNHDKTRAIVRYGEKGSLAASFFIFTLRGVPLVYNGMEIGDTAESTAPALFERLPIFWKTSQIRQEHLLFYKQIIRLRKKHPSFYAGLANWVNNSDKERIVSYFRKAENEEFLYVINMSNRPFEGTIDTEEGSKYEDLTPIFKVNPEQSSTMLPNISMKPWDFRLFKKIVQ